MLNEQDLQAIANLMHDFESRMTVMMEAKLDSQKQELHGEIKEFQSQMMALMEAYFEPKFNLLADGQALIKEKLTPAEELDDMRDRLDVLEAITRRNTRDIEKLKKAQ